ncbi:WhiB family transcriptional regulator, partial [Frankia sp. EI5c]|uniref:WhiB family transcriptional regulator n=1 Tax=Frankia sp. EI5c TaxID=683316 RepID=UPI001041EF1F
MPQVSVPPLLSWKSAGACGQADLDLFFVPEGLDARAKERREAAAKRICAGCAVRKECLGYAVEAAEPHGIWGGLTERERSGLRRHTAPPGNGRRRTPNSAQ